MYSTILRDFPIPLRYPNKKTIRSYIRNLCLWLGALLVTTWFNCRFIETIHWTMIRKPQVHHSVIMLTTYGVLLTSFEKYSILKLQEKKKLMKYLSCLEPIIRCLLLSLLTVYEGILNLLDVSYKSLFKSNLYVGLKFILPSKNPWKICSVNTKEIQNNNCCVQQVGQQMFLWLL